MLENDYEGCGCTILALLWLVVYHSILVIMLEGSFEGDAVVVVIVITSQHQCHHFQAVKQYE